MTLQAVPIIPSVASCIFSSLLNTVTAIVVPVRDKVNSILVPYYRSLYKEIKSVSEFIAYLFLYQAVKKTFRCFGNSSPGKEDFWIHPKAEVIALLLNLNAAVFTNKNFLPHNPIKILYVWNRLKSIISILYFDNVYKKRTAPSAGMIIIMLFSHHNSISITSEIFMNYKC